VSIARGGVYCDCMGNEPGAVISPVVAPARLETGWYLPEVLISHAGPARPDPEAPDFAEVIAELNDVAGELDAVSASGSTAPLDFIDIPVPKWEPLTVHD